MLDVILYTTFKLTIAAICAFLFSLVIIVAMDEAYDPLSNYTPVKAAANLNDHSEVASRARYRNARGTYDRAWGSFNLLLVTHDGHHQVVVGLDKTECEALYGVLLEEAARAESESWRAKWVTPCYESVETVR